MNRLVWHGDAVARKINRTVPAIMMRIKENIADKARQIVPVKTGKLKRSIKATEKGIEVTEPYALVVEIGSATKAANPFLRPSIERFNGQDLKQSIR